MSEGGRDGVISRRKARIVFRPALPAAAMLPASKRWLSPKVAMAPKPSYMVFRSAAWEFVSLPTYNTVDGTGISGSWRPPRLASFPRITNGPKAGC